MAHEETRKNTFDVNNKLHVITVSGRQFVTWAGLQARLGDQGKSIVGTDIEVLSYPWENDEKKMVVKCFTEVADKQGNRYTFRDIADAASDSVGKAIVPHLMRMASTRGHARNLRVATRSEFTAIDEINRDEIKKEN